MFITTLPADHVAVSGLMGEPVKTVDDETLGDINDVLMNKAGQVTAILIGPGGLLGVGGRLVAVPLSALTIVDTGQGPQVRLAGLSKDEVLGAPEYQVLGETALGRLMERAATLGHTAAGRAAEIGHKAAEKTSELGHKAAEKVSELGQKASESASEIGHRAVDQITNLAQKAVPREADVEPGAPQGPDDRKSNAEQTAKDPNKTDGPSR